MNGRTISDLLSQFVVMEGIERAIYPGGVDVCLALLGLGATIDSKLDISLLQRFGNDQNMLTFLQEVNSLQLTPDIKTITCMFFDNTLDISLDYYDVIKDTTVTALDNFPKMIIEGTAKINKRIYDNLGFGLQDVGKPGFVIGKDLLNANFIMINTMWFRDNWISQFDVSLTSIQKFTKTSWDTISIPMMSQILDVDYYSLDNLEGIRLKFVNGAIAEFMMGLPIVSDFNDQYKYIRQRSLIYLPKFTIKKTINLVPLLTKSDYRDIFSKGNLDRIAIDCSVDMIKQGINISFLESGTNQNILSVAKNKFPIENIPVVSFNYPFHYRIMKNNIMLINGFYDGS